MASRVYPSEDGYSIRGIAPPDLARQTDSIKLMFWGWVMEAGLKQKDRDLARGLDKDGKVMRISAYTRQHRKSAMTPSGKGDPSAPALEPGRQKSRTRSLLTGKAFTDHAEFWWKFDPHIGDSWARILEKQQEQGRDVFGLSPAALKRVIAYAWDRYGRWKSGQTVELPVVINVAQAPAEIPVVGSTNFGHATFGIGGAPRGQFSGGMRIEDWFKHYRQPARVSIPGRPKAEYNRLLGTIWRAIRERRYKPRKPVKK
jgi:hypothetical protein